ncbi:unnamed protein product [Mytilus coruscus]|uniref:Uncharacterized protein n=1 Tax=Mytilus coruscus TaxID=42192 RepID=A0A6J8DV52_MYTCO|nr:unnamed protein product [Mytilus coruscus]
MKQENVKVAFKSFQEPFDLTLKYSAADKIKIAGKYLKADYKLLSDIVIKDGFSPLMCFLYSQHDSFDVNEFLNSPYETFSDEWDELKTIDKEKFCVLLLCVLYNGSINKDIFYEDSGKQEKRKLKDVFELCELGRDTSRSAIKNKIKACVDTYFIEINKEYKVIHDKMFDFLCCYFGKQLITPILKFGNNKLIGERVQLGSIQQPHREFTIVISSNNEGKYFDRLRTDLENGKIHCCLNNWQMKYMVYRQKFLDVFKYLSNDLKSNLINTQDDNGINSFIVSCLHGYEELVSHFISEGADVSARNGLFTPLTAACRDGHLKTVEILLDKGSTVNQTNIDGETPLYTDCSCGHYSLVTYLIERHADINKRNKYNSSCLIVASYGGHEDIVAKLILKDCDIDSYDILWKTAIFVACEEGYTNIVKLLIGKNADIFRVDTDGRTPLHAACCLDNDDIANILIRNDADVNMLDVDFETPLHKACRKGSARIIQILLDNGADIDKANRDGHTPAHLVKSGNKILDEHILKALQDDEPGPAVGTYLTKIKKDTIWKQEIASTSSSIRYEWTPLYEACGRGDKETVISLIRNRADVNMKTSSGEMPLVVACQQGHGVIIQILLDEKSDVNEALCCAVEKDYDRAAKILLFKGGDLSYKGVNEKSLMTLARERGSIKTIKILLKQGAKFKEIDANGKTLIYAVENKARFDLLQFISDKGLDLDIPDKDGNFPLFVSEDDTKTALISVFESGNKELSKLLVTYGYTENLSNFNDTMLYHACRLGLNEKVEMFLRNGSDIQKTYSYGYTPLILADIGGNDDLLEHLQRKECIYESIRNKVIVLNYKPGEVYVTLIGESIENVSKIQHLFPTETKRKVHHYECQKYQHLFKACMFGEGKAFSFLSLPLNCFFKPTEPFMSIWFTQTPLCLAISRGHTEVVKSLIKHGVNVNLTFEKPSFNEDDSLSTTIRYGYTPLFSACQRKYYEIVDMLLKKGANLNMALHDACREGYLDTVQFLLQKGAGVNSFGRYGQTALYAACIGGYYTIVKFLIEQGALIDMKVYRANMFDITCLHAAYQYGNFCIFQLLLNKGASVDTKDNFGRTLLHKASTEGKYEVVEILLEKEGDIDASDMNGVTPLIACLLQTEKASPRQTDFQYQMMPANHSLGEHYIYQMQKDYPEEPSDLEKKNLNVNHYKVVQKLIQNGVDINKADRKERTPLSIARQIGDIKLIDMLLMEKHPISQ